MLLESTTSYIVKYSVIALNVKEELLLISFATGLTMDRRGFIGSLLGSTAIGCLPFLAERPKEKIPFVPYFRANLSEFCADNFELIIHTNYEPIKGTRLLSSAFDPITNLRMLEFEGVVMRETLVVRGASILHKDVLLITTMVPLVLCNGDTLHCSHRLGTYHE